MKDEGLDLERFEPGLPGRLAYEHIHRYAFCVELARGKRVLDAACGQGYGSALLSETATHVVGVDCDPSTIARARQSYASRGNTMFMTADCVQLPFADAEFDLVVSFETLEHVELQNQMLAEFARVLKPEGILVISTPNRPVYSPPSKPPNPYHVKELDLGEFVSALKKCFRHVRMLGQRFQLGSTIAELAEKESTQGHASYQALLKERGERFAVRQGVAAPVDPEFLIAICANAIEAPSLPPSMYLDLADDLWSQQLAFISWAEGLRDEEKRVREHAGKLEAQVRSSAADLDAERRHSSTLLRMLELSRGQVALLEEDGRVVNKSMAEVVQRSAQLAEVAGMLRSQCGEEADRCRKVEEQLATEINHRRTIASELNTSRLNVAELEQRHALERSRQSARIAELEADLIARTAQIEVAGRREIETAEAIRRLERELAVQKEQVEQANRREAEVAEAIRKLERELAVRKEQIEQANRREAEAAEAIRKLERELDNKCIEISELRHADEQALEAQLAATRSALFDRAMQISDLNRILAQHETASAGGPRSEHSGFNGAHSAPLVMPAPMARPHEAAVVALARREPAPTPTAVTAGDIAKQKFREDARRRLNAFLAGSERIVLPTSSRPRVSIVIVLFNQAELTFDCLRTLGAALDVASEVIIVDNDSRDDTAELCARVDGARIIRNKENLHFLKGVNLGAKECRGDAILLLNNDTKIKPGSIRSALRCLDEEPSVGAVGGKIVLLDGTLQEAGSIIWRDGSCLGYGRGRSPDEPEFKFRRDVDYCSGAFILIRQSLFERLGWFDVTFAPAYYEETDLCMRVRDAGFRIVYDPQIEIEHFEFGSQSTSDKAIEMQRRNHKIFLNRHGATLEASHLPSGTRPLDARMRPGIAGRLLVLDDQVPYPRLGQGFPRAHAMHEAVLRNGWFITFYPTSFPDVSWDEAYRLYPAEVEIAAGLGRAGLQSFLASRADYYDAILVSRPHNMEFVNTLLAAEPELLGRTRVIYDAEAIVAPREALKRKLAGRPLAAKEQQKALQQELSLARHADCVIAVSETEAEIFRSAVTGEVVVVGHAVEPAPTIEPFEARRDVLFVGALDVDDSPNVDSLVWFVESVMPLLDKLIGSSWRLRVAGTNKSQLARRLAGPRVELLGLVDDLRPLYGGSRLFIAPTRFAAGIPMKAHEAAAAGLPMVSSRLIAQQLTWSHDRELMAADDPAEFALSCAKLYEDRQVWEKIRAAALRRVETECSSRVFDERLAEVLKDCLQVQ